MRMPEVGEKGLLKATHCCNGKPRSASATALRHAEMTMAEEGFFEPSDLVTMAI